MASSFSNSLQRQKRVRLERTVSLKFKDLEGFCTELSENISMGGMFLRTAAPQPPGTLFDFELRLEEGGPLIQGIGEVVWVREEDEVAGKPAGMGVCFLELAPGSRALIYQVVDQHISRGGQPFELTATPAGDPPAEAPETAPVSRPIPEPIDEPIAVWPSEPPPEPRPVRAGSYAVLASPQRKRDEVPPGSSSREARRRPLPRRRSAGRGLWIALGVAALLALAAAALWYGYGLWYGADGEPEPRDPAMARVDEAGAARDPLASVVPMEAPESPPEEPADLEPAEPESTDPEPAELEPAEPAEPDPIEPEPTEPQPAEPQPEPADPPPPVPDTPEPSTVASATVLREITWRRRGEALEVILTADGPLRDGWSHFRMDQGTPREVVRVNGIREPFRPTVQVGEPEVRQIRTGHHRRANGDELHVVFDLASSRVTLLEIEAEGPRLRLLLR